MKTREVSEIELFLQGDKIDKDIVRRLKEGDKTLWETLLNTVAKGQVDVQFSADLITLLEKDGKQWLFLKAYLHKVVSSLSRPETIPLVDLSGLAGYLKFKRQVLQSQWLIKDAQPSVLKDCLKFLAQYLEKLNEMERAGVLLNADKMTDEIKLLSCTIYPAVLNKLGRGEVEKIWNKTMLDIGDLQSLNVEHSGENR